MKVVLGSDKYGFELKNHIKDFLIKKGYEVVDMSEEPSKDFVDSTKKVAQVVKADKEARGILFDKTGAGSFIIGCKIPKIIIAELSEERTAYMTRIHNNATIITLGQEIVGKCLAENIVKEFLQTDYASGRHQVRVDMLNAMC